MVLANLLLYVAGGVIELISLVFCINFFDGLCKIPAGKIKIIFSAIVYISILAFNYFFVIALGYSIGVVAIMLYYLALVLALFIIYGHLNFKIIYLIVIMDLTISLIKTNTSYLMANILEKSIDYVSPFVSLAIQIIVLILILLTRRKSSTQRNIFAFEMIPRHIFIMLILTILCLSALSSLISYPTDNLTRKENALTAVVAILTVILICIVISLFLNVIAKQHITAVSQMMEKQVKLQINHYRELEKIDAEIRRFRHDYTNHLQSILSLIQMNECSQAEEYILKLKKVKYKSDLHIFYTGNRLADAILSDKSSSLNESCQIDYSGIIPNSIENVDLCIILSNSLDNAIEACREQSSPSVISIYATSQQGYFVLSIKNPTICSDNYYDIPTTSKADKEQHGMGLYNIEDIVKKYGGQMKIKCENGFFELMITMKI